MHAYIGVRSYILYVLIEHFVVILYCIVQFVKLSLEYVLTE